MLAILQQAAGLLAFDAVERDDVGSHGNGGLGYRGGRLLDTMVFYVSAVSSRCVWRERKGIEPELQTQNSN